MANTVKEISASYFRRYASLHPEIWNEIIGNEIVHVTWGKCLIEKLDADKSYLQISGRKVHIGGFIEKEFGSVKVSSELAETILAYIERRDELDELEWAEQDRRKLLEAQRQAELHEEAQRIEREKKKLEDTRIAKIQEESEKRKLLELERQRELLAIREVESRMVKQQRAVAIQRFCKARGIHWLFHFTRLANLDSILRNGLVGRMQLQNLNLPNKPVINDSWRLDGLPNAVCISISHPNYLLFHKFSLANKKEWVVLVLEPYILWEFDCAFFETNAASGSVKSVPLAQRKEYSLLLRMFEDLPSVRRCNLGIPNYYTTDPQAEVLVLEAIAPEYITSVHFYDNLTMTSWLDEHKPGSPTKYVANREYFNARMDYPMWRSPGKRSWFPNVSEEQVEF